MKELDDLVQVTDAFKEQALERHRRNLDVSRALAEELAQIDALRMAVQADTQSLGARRLSGADALWQGWLVRKRADILRQSAMARAHELESLASARTAFARAEAANELRQEARDEARQKRLAKDADTIDALSLLRHAQKVGA